MLLLLVKKDQQRDIRKQEDSGIMLENVDRKGDKKVRERDNISAK